VYKKLVVDGTGIPTCPRAMKLLDVTLQCSLKWDQHEDLTNAKVNSRKFLISVLKRAGVQLKDLVTFYCTVAKPVVEYVAQVYSTRDLLTNSQTSWNEHSVRCYRSSSRT